MAEISLDFLKLGQEAERQLGDIFSDDLISRTEALKQGEREKRMREVDASKEFDKLLAKQEILDVFIRLKDK